MQKTTTNIGVGGGQVRARVRIVGGPCDIGTIECRMAQYGLLRALADSPDLTACALAPFQNLHMYHDGTAWVVEAEAIVDDPQGTINARPPPSPTAQPTRV